MTVTGRTRPLLGFKGELQSGKSAVAAALRFWAGSGTDSQSDIEFSDAIMEAANYALGTGVRLTDQFREALCDGAQHVLALTVRPELDGYYHNHTGTAKCPECVLVGWLREIPHSYQITRETKDADRAVYMWLGVIIRLVVAEDVWAQEVRKRIKAAGDSPLVTAGGVRFREDGEAIRAEGGLIVEVIGRKHNADDDPTNVQRSQVTPDVLLYNDVYDPTLERVREVTAQVWRDFRSGSLRGEYRVRR